MNKRLGRQTVAIENPPIITCTASIVGEKEGHGPLSKYFDIVLKDDKMAANTWEDAESRMQKSTVAKLFEKSDLCPSDIDYILAGDLMNQCVATHYGIRDYNIPFYGLYGACSTMIEGLSLGSLLIGGGFADNVLAMTSSHFCSAEKQFRFPLEYGGQRAPAAQWTVTGCGCAALSKSGIGPKVTHVTTGKIVDMGVTDIGNMGAAMAPAAIDTLSAHFHDTGFRPDDYDLIVTGDLGLIGSEILVDLLRDEGYDISRNHTDCGIMMFDIEKQDVHSGGSGCGCCASVFCGYLYKKLMKKEVKKILVMATGALMNPIIVEQGESIPAIAHAVSISI